MSLLLRNKDLQEGGVVIVKLFETFRQKWMLRHERDVPQAETISHDAPRVETTLEILDGEVPDETVRKFSSNEASERLALLTPRERNLFLLLLEGYTLKESAKKMDVKYSTANTHMTGIYKKLNVSSRAELIINYLNLSSENSKY